MVREYMKHNRRTVINNTSTQVAGEALLKKIYRVMDRMKANECYINMLETDRYAELDLFYHGKLISWAVPVSVRKED